MRFLPFILLLFSACMQERTVKIQDAKENMELASHADITVSPENAGVTEFSPNGGTKPEKIIVGKDQKVTSLKKAIEIVKDRDTIVLQQGLYKEGNIVLTKSISIVGEDFPVLDGENKYEILTISGSKILIKGIHFQNTGRNSLNDFAAVKIIDAKEVSVVGNKISNAYFAIHLSNSYNCSVSGNEITGTPTTEQNTGNGIHLWKCENALIEKNSITGHRDGIYFEFVTHSLIRENKSEKNIRYGLHFMFSHNDDYLGNTFRNNGAGVAVMYSKNVHMERNHFDKNWGNASYGILLKDISDSRINKNQFQQNTVGIFMEGTNRIEVFENEFRENGWAIKVQASCNENNFHHNNFLSNSFDVATNGTMVLNKFHNNFWDKYAGYDMNRDGFGDVPYHPVSMYAMIVEQNPNALILLRSFMVSLLDQAEKAIPSLTPEELVDDKPTLNPLKL